jgi:hypothetical protein
MSQYAPIIITPESIKRSTHIARSPLKGNYTVPVEPIIKKGRKRERGGEGKRKKKGQKRKEERKEETK